MAAGVALRARDRDPLMMPVAATPLVDWFGAPRLESGEATRRAHVLWLIAWSFFGLLALMLAAAIVATPETLARRGTSSALVGALVLIIHFLNRRGRTEVGAWALVLGLAVVVTQRAWHTGGVHAPVALFYVMFVLMAAGLLGKRGAILTTLACVASATLLTGAELAGLLTPPPSSGSVALAYIAVALSLAVTLLCLRLFDRPSEPLAPNDLVNMFVHDMRSPLTVVMARLSLLRSEVVDGSDSALHADAAMADAMRINRMANNLLDIGRLEQSKLPLYRNPIDVAHLAREVADSLRALDPTRHIEVRARVPAVCECDTELLRRVIENLITNALKHTPPHGHIFIHVSSGDVCVRLAVQDEGPGVPRESRDRIFSQYSARGMRAASGYHSVGLGLAFCRLAVAAHGGRLWVEDAKPHGSVFIVELPVQE
jgi:signal transduction histidine kinase